MYCMFLPEFQVCLVLHVLPHPPQIPWDQEDPDLPVERERERERERVSGGVYVNPFFSDNINN